MYENPYQYINSNSPDVHEQQYIIYQKFKYPEVLYERRLDHHLSKSLCEKHPYISFIKNVYNKKCSWSQTKITKINKERPRMKTNGGLAFELVTNSNLGFSKSLSKIDRLLKKL